MSYFKFLSIVLMALSLAAIFLITQYEGEDTINGLPEVIDGGTMRFHLTTVRLKGVDAPDLAQVCLKELKVDNCGLQARAALLQIIKKRILRCVSDRKDPLGQVLATCSVEGVDIGAEMVKSGMAVASDASYKREEDQARQACAGMWAGLFERPAEWKKTKVGSMVPLAIGLQRR